jgi:HD-GYP domain-containing protein (c-di-GMP phosphodiesterase class II)
MRRVAVDQLRAGDRIGRDVHARPDLPALLRVGVRVSDSFRQSLARAGVMEVWIDDVVSQGIEPLELLSPETKSRTSAAIRDAFHDAAAALASGQPLPARTVRDMATVAELIVKEIAGSVHAALALNDLASADGYTMKHSLAVTTLGLALGLRVMQRHGWVDAMGKRRFDSVEDRLLPFGVGLLLHDVGKLAVPGEILQKPGKLTDEEWATIKTHPMEGVRILQHAEISPLTRAVVRSHHERWDGAGYPERKTGTEIHQFPRIAAVVDVFDALTSDRHYRRAWPMHQGWQFIVDRASQDFDPEVVEVFEKSVAPYPPGTGVILSDGYRGIVKEIPKDAVARPIVRVVADPSGAEIPFREVELAREPGLTIVSTDMGVGLERAG